MNSLLIGIADGITRTDLETIVPKSPKKSAKGRVEEGCGEKNSD